MRYLRVYASANGDSRFEDVELQGTLTHIVDGVPPLLVSGPFACREITFVEQPKDASDGQVHVAPRKQWIIILSGHFAITTTDGDRRTVGPGDVVLAEDTAGKGHLTTRISGDVRVAMIPVLDQTST
jgi:hypothetical protein